MRKKILGAPSEYIGPVKVPVAIIDGVPVDGTPQAFFADGVRMVDEPVVPDGTRPRMVFPGRVGITSLFAVVPTFYGPVGTVGGPVPTPVTLQELGNDTSAVFSHGLIAIDEVGVVPSGDATIETGYRM